MVCIYCGHETQVVNSRPQQKMLQVWRRRKCSNCGNLFTTTERIELSKSILIRKSNLKIESFIKEKLLFSIHRSLGHRSDPVSDSIAITDTICAKLLKNVKQPLVERQQIIKLVTDTLNHFDKVAAVHYGAYHPLADKK